MLKAPHVVLVKRFDPTGEELTRWEPLVLDADGRPEFLSETRAKAAAQKPPRDADLHVGDLITVVPVDALSDIDNHARALFVVTPHVVEVAPPVSAVLRSGSTWTAAWGQDAQTMLGASSAVDRRRLVLAACDCAETVLHLVPAGEDRPRIALETARAWCLGRATQSEVQGAADDAYDADLPVVVPIYLAASSTNDAKDAKDAAGAAADALTPRSGGWSQAVYDDALRSMAPLVERWIPLPVILLSDLGYPDAIPLNLDGVQSAQAPHSPTRSRQ